MEWHWLIEVVTTTLLPVPESIIQSHYKIVVKPVVVHSDVNVIKMDSNILKYAGATISRITKMTIF